MPELIKTVGIVLRKIDFGDTSKIATLITPEFGKLSVIIKGGRTGKSRIGALVDTLNEVEVIFYDKKSRDVQLVSQADLLNNFTRIKDDFEKLKHASAALELVNVLTVENHEYDRLYRGLKKILLLLNTSDNDSRILFVKFFLFLLKELGYEFQYDNCTFCGKELTDGSTVKFNYELGMMCDNCSPGRIYSFEFSPELFNSLICLSRKNYQTEQKFDNIDKLIYFLERYLMYHINEFKGLKSLHIL